MELLQTRNIDRGRRSQGIRFTRSQGRLSRSHTHHVESSHTPRNSPRIWSRINYRRQLVKIGPVNHLLHFMFNQIDVYFNQKLVSPPNNAYAYRAYIETLLSYASPARNSHLTSCL